MNFSIIVSALIKDGIITQEKAEYASKIQHKISSSKTLLEIMNELGYINEKQIKQTLKKNKLSLRIGDLLVELGHLSKDKLAAAIEIQKNNKQKKIGEILVDHKFISESDFLGILSAQMDFPLIKPDLMEIPLGLFSKASSRWYKDHKVIPVSIENQKVILAFADPLDIHIITKAKTIFGKDIIIGVAASSQILKTIEKLENRIKHNKPEVFDESSATGIINNIISSAIADEASDIHIEPMGDKLQIRFRIDGINHSHADKPLENNE